jgi:hypothetical protein
VMAPKYRTMTEYKKVASFGRFPSTITVQRCLEPEKSSDRQHKQSKEARGVKGKSTYASGQCRCTEPQFCRSRCTMSWCPRRDP